MRVLITGGSGFVGLNLVEAFLGRGHDVTLADLNAAPQAATAYFTGLPGRLETRRLDVTDARAVSSCVNEAGPEIIVHAAALAPCPAKELATTALTAAINIGGAVNALEAAHMAGVKRFISTGSAAMYGVAALGAKILDEEATPPFPEHIYGITKLAAERIALRYRAVTGLEVICVRIGSVYGPWEWETGSRDTLSPMLQALRLHAVGEAAILPRPGRRDWVYGREVGAAVVALAESPQLRHPLYNIASGTEWTVADWCAAVSVAAPEFRWRLAEAGEAANVDLFAATDRPPLNVARLACDVGTRYRRRLPDIVADHLAWVRQNPGFPSAEA